jgi:hypothetical protein
MKALMTGLVLASIILLATDTTTSGTQSAAIDKAPAFQSIEEWKNPLIMIHAEGFELVAREGERTMTTLTVADLEDLLLSLPKSAWPMGRVVAVQENGIHSAGDCRTIETNRILLGVMLGENEFDVTWVPTA